MKKEKKDEQEINNKKKHLKNLCSLFLKIYSLIIYNSLIDKFFKKFNSLYNIKLNYFEKNIITKNL